MPEISQILNTYVCVCVCVYIYIYIYICVCVRARVRVYFILGFKYHVFNASRWSVRPKHVACADETNKI